MKPFICSHDYSTVSGTGIRYGQLVDCWNCIAETTLNGDYELSFNYPADSWCFDKLIPNNIVFATNSKNGNPQPYRIYRVTKVINGVVTVYARHRAQADLSGIPVTPYTADDFTEALGKISTQSAITNPFTFSSTKTSRKGYSLIVPTPALNVLMNNENSLRDNYGGEIDFDNETVIYEARIGADNGTRITYGVNMSNFEQDTNIQNTYTGAIGYWHKDDVGTQVSNIINAQGAFDYQRIATVDLSDKFDVMPDTSRLDNAVTAYINDNQIGIPRVSISLSFVDLEQVTDFAGIKTSIDLGDTVHVHFEKIGVTADARVVKTRWNVLLDRYESVDIGTAKVTLADTIAGLIKKK